MKWVERINNFNFNLKCLKVEPNSEAEAASRAFEVADRDRRNKKIIIIHCEMPRRKPIPGSVKEVFKGIRSEKIRIIMDE